MHFSFSPLQRLLLIVLITSLVLGVNTQRLIAQAPSAATDPEIPFDAGVTQGQLANGMRYFIKTNAKPENFAELRLVVNAGSLLENEEQQGLAHFLEHMAFNGTESFPKNDLINFLEKSGTRFGAHLNAYTSFDETVYMLRVPTDSLELFQQGLQILEEWSHRISLDGEEIEKERGVVIEEWRARLGAMDRMSHVTLPKRFYQSRYADRLPIGKREIVETFSHQSLKDFYKTWYRPDLMSLVAVGDFDPQELEGWIKEIFAKVPVAKDPVERPIYPMPDHQETLIAIASDPEASFNRISLTFKHPKKSLTSVYDYRMELVRSLGVSMLSNRLSELTQSATPPFTIASAGYGNMVRSKASFSNFAIAPTGQILSSLSALITENERALRFGFTQSELERTKKTRLRSMEKQFKEKDKMESRNVASGLVSHALTGAPYPGVANMYMLNQQILPGISLEEVNQVMEQLISKENLVVEITGSSAPENKMPNEAQIDSVLKSVKQAELEAFVDEVNEQPLLAEIPTAAPSLSKEYYEDTDITLLTLANGIKVYLKPTEFKNDQIMLEAYSSGGLSLYADSVFTSGNLATQVIGQSGLGSYSQIELNKFLSDKALRISPYIGELYEGMRGSTSPQDQETFYQILHLYFTQVRQDEAAFQSLLSRIKGIYGNLLSRPEYYFQDKLSKLLAGDTVRSGFPTIPQLETANLGTIHRIYQERFANPSDFTFFMVGNFDLAETENYLNTYLGSLPGTPSEESWNDRGDTSPKGVLKQDFFKGQEPKAQVRLFLSGDFDWNMTQRYHLQSTIEVLRIMLREAMREDQGGVYGVGAFGSSEHYPTSSYRVGVSFTCAPENVDTLIQTVLSSMEQLQQAGPSADNLVKVKEIQRKEFEENQQKNSFWMARMQFYHQHGLDMTKLAPSTKHIEALSAEDIQQAAQQYFSQENFLQAVLYPETSSTDK